MKSVRQNRILAVTVGAALLLGVGATGSAVADRLIGSHQIKNNSVRSVDVKNGTLKVRDLRSDVAAKIRDQDAGEIVANALTPANPNIGPGLHVVAVPSVATSSGAPDASTGVQLIDPIQLPAGTYLVRSTVQFFDFDGGGADSSDFGVTRLFLNGVAVPTSASWSPEVPDDANNAAQASGTIVVTVPAGGGTLTAKAVIRGGDSGHAGGSAIITRLG